MYSTKTAITMSLSLKDLLEKLDDYTIYSYYLGSFKPKTLMNSPLRPDDKIPSFAIFPSKTGDLLFKDHGTGEAGNALKFIKLYRGIQTREELERELLKIVRRMNPNETIRTNNYTKLVGSGVTDIGIVRQPFTLALNTFFVIESSEEPTKKIVLCMPIRFMIVLRFIGLQPPSILNGVPI